MPHPGTGTLKNKIFEDPLFISFLGTAIFSPSTMVLDPYLFHEFSAQLSFWHLPFQPLCMSSKFSSQLLPLLFTQKKKGWKSKIFLLLLPLALLLIKRDPRDLLICSSLLEASLLPSFLLTWFSISDLFHFPSTPTLIAPSSLLPTCVPLSKSSRIHAGNLIGNYYLLSLQTKSKQPERAAIWEVLMSNHETMAWLI